jgi:hypothetical protein
MTVTYGDWIHKVVATFVFIDVLSVVVTRAVPMRYGPECTLFRGMHVIQQWSYLRTVKHAQLSIGQKRC